MEVEHEVQLAHILKVVVQDLHKQVDGLQLEQLIVAHINAHGEEEAGIAAVDHLVCAVLQAEGGFGERKRTSSLVGVSIR